MGYLPTWWKCCCSQEMEGESGPTELEDRDLVPRLEILGGILKSPRNRLLSLSFYCSESWGVNGDEWWLCRVSHGSYPFTVDRNRCHRFWETGGTGFHLTRGLLSIFSKLHFSFHSPFFLCPLYSFLHNPPSQIWIFRDFDEMGEIQSLQSLEIEMSSFFWTWDNLVIYG
jgi:hypothetical protein